MNAFYYLGKNINLATKIYQKLIQLQINFTTSVSEILNDPETDSFKNVFLDIAIQSSLKDYVLENPKQLKNCENTKNDKLSVIEAKHCLKHVIQDANEKCLGIPMSLASNELLKKAVNHGFGGNEVSDAIRKVIWLWKCKNLKVG